MLPLVGARLGVKCDNGHFAEWVKMVLDKVNMDDVEQWVRTGFQYLWFILIGGAGGIASYISKLRRDKAKTFSIVEVLGEIFISGFVALITALICIDMGLSEPMTFAACGIAGHMGTRALYLVEQKILDFIDKKYS